MQGTFKQALGRVQNILKRKPKRWKVIVGNEELMAQEYAGYSVLYAQGNPLIGRIKYAEELYEHETLGALCDELRLRKALTFLDVGANIGLISLPLLRRFPDLRIEAFEPGPHQSSLLEETIKYNNLASRLFLHKTALADYKGETDFYIHSYGDMLNGGSGDGLIDTGRAGSAKKIRVPVERLDDWWIRAGSPDVRVVKIDTEGAELLILKGARLFLETCRPSLFLEIWPENLRGYLYSPEDVLHCLEGYGYRLFTLQGKRVFRGRTEDDWLKGDGSYIAQPV
jgi:FkbM family methyltransferase